MIILISSVFVIGYVLISIEHKLQVSKSAIALLLAVSLWALIGVGDHTHAVGHLKEAGADIFEILVFLLTAMALVEILVHYKFFDAVRTWLTAKTITTVQQVWVISALAFIVSTVINNMTTAIVFTQLSRLFFKGKNLLIVVALIIIAANAGGAFSPIGDVTTTMLWLRGKFTSGQVVLYGFIPSLIIYLVAATMLTFKVDKSEFHVSETDDFKLLRSEKLVIGCTFGSFALPFVFNSLGLRPYMGLLAGLAITWIVIDLLKKRLPNHRSHFSASIEKLLQNTDIASLKFFIGILLAVAALNHLGILGLLSNSLFGHNPGLPRFIAGSSAMGLFSAIVDNVPLTAASMDIVRTTDPSIWVLIALTVGTGGSILVIGSAAGVMAMGIVKDLNFATYLKIAALPAALGYGCGIAVWYLERLLLS